MAWAAFTLAFFGFMHCSEFTYQGVSKFSPHLYLCSTCVSFYPSLASPQYMTVTLQSSKTESFRAGQSLLIAWVDSPVCAVTAMQHYFQVVSPPKGPLFYFQSSRLLTRSSVVCLLAGLPYHSLKGHSFRIGAASTAAAAGLPDWLIKAMGRWSSDCYQIYIRTPQQVLLSAAPRMASVSPSFLSSS